ncbi:Stk1 family PASTA domain-containing Ser/Thr kinase [Aquiluna sp. KACHI24]|uniref:Stk1 family PASTA domain-containing Ser/Thr kinase n=1 Tax=Aquiluna sp. KACHI24 TaxID=2968831 RepID=UPI0021F96872|nr:Stk1 family PASTA domain-containing Ser/Thr kinase [Aquiluna sp. KACHI24]BDP99695.1 putative serine/threonine-protein kinase PknB [Aquiluna sp. KACHI24]
MNENERLIAGRYRLGALVGRGGMAEVFEGYDTRLGRTIAIKLLKSDLANDANFESRFRQEAQASARMAHPTIVRVYDAGEEESVDENGQTRKTPFIVMELVRGRLLRELIHEGPVEISKAVKFVSGILTALEVSHSAGVVHRDIKPANVMVVDGDQVKVMDFGIARAVSDNSATQAATAGIVGTAQYFSPEQARGEGVDARTDLYSTGVILYELLAGRPPFQGESAVSVAYQHVSEAAAAPSQFNPNVSAELDAVVLRAMSKNKEERFQSAAEFREHLLAASAAFPTAPRTQVYVAEKTELITNPVAPITSEQSAVDEIFGSLQTAPTQAVTTEATKLNAGVLWGLGTGVAVILVGLLVWLFSLGGASNPSVNPGGITVANVEGSLYDDAYNTLIGQELLVLRVYEKSDTVPEGVVIRQEPIAGTNVLANTPITLYVSSGATEVVVPNVLNVAEAQAVAMIEGQGLTIGTITVVSSATVPEGVVIATDPAVGGRLPLGSVVNLTLSNGKVLVPDVRNLSVLEARSILTAPTIGYTVSIEIIDSATCTGTPGNVVIEQSILPGEAAQLQNMVLYVQCVGASPSPSPTPSPTETTQG